MEKTSLEILVVDDEKTNRDLIGFFLELEGYKVYSAGNVFEARVKLEEGKPNLVISDYSMPNGLGTDLLKYIRQDLNTMDIPFILISSQIGTKTKNEHEIISRAQKVNCGGPIGYDKKPFNFQLFKETINDLLQGSYAQINNG